MTLRADLVLATAVALVFGLAVGILIGHSLAGASRPGPAARPDAGDGHSHADQQDVAQALAVHEKLMAESPDDFALARTVGNYRSMSGDLDGALEAYDTAERLAREQSADDAALAEILVDRGVAYAEAEQVPEALEQFEEAARVDPQDLRSRLSLVYLLVTRVLPAPPPGWDRKSAVKRAEELIDEVLALEPDQPDALQFRDLIATMRATAPGAMPPVAAAPGTAPATP